MLGVLVVVALGAGTWWFFLRDGAPIQLGEPEHPIPDFSFDLSKVNGTAPGGEVQAQEVRGAADGIRETLDAMYVAGFVDPSKWEGGTFPEVLEQFEGSAAERASADLAFLTLGGEADQVAFVEPAVGTLKIRVLLGEDRAPAGAVATTRFVGDGEFDDGAALFVIHRGTYYLRPDGDRWLITGYDVHGVVQPGSRPTGSGVDGTDTGATP
ncbi:MAG: hypothetical protein ACRDKA_09130 [Actinomycetota bacterium]